MGLVLKAILIIVLVGVAFVLFSRARRLFAGGRDRSRSEEAVRLRRELVRRVRDAEVADRLAERELQRDPDIDMAEAYRRALAQLKADRRH